METTKNGVKLLGGWASPFVMRTRIALNIKSVKYEFLEETPGSKSQLLLQSNPVYKKIPVLIHNGHPICESIVIVQYVDEAWSTSPTAAILPSDPLDRATARFWAAYVDDQCKSSVDAVLVAQDEAKEAAVKKFREVLATLEGGFAACSKGKSFFGGERIGLVDIALGSFLGWLKVLETLNSVKLIDDDTTPGLSGWAERFFAEACVKEVMPETEKLLEFTTVVRAILKAREASNK